MAAIALPIDSDFGYATFAIGDKSTGKVDLQAAHDHYFSLLAKQQADGKPEEWLWCEWKGYLATFNFPDGLSVASCVRIVEAIIDAVKDLQKKGRPPASSGGADSAASTGSPAST